MKKIFALLLLALTSVTGSLALHNPQPITHAP